MGNTSRLSALTLLVALSATTLPACEPRYPEGVYKCGTKDLCPGDMVCRSGFCFNARSTRDGDAAAPDMLGDMTRGENRHEAGIAATSSGVSESEIHNMDAGQSRAGTTEAQPDAGSTVCANKACIDAAVESCSSENELRCSRKGAGERERCVGGKWVATQSCASYCDDNCASGHGTPECSRGGSCDRIQCEAGHADCDSDIHNGCETDLNTVDNCGACGKKCSATEGGTATCSAGECSTECDLSGTYALKVVAQVDWPATSFIAAGSGAANSWGDLRVKHTGNSLTGTLTQCGNDAGPHINHKILTDEWYNLQFPDSLFDRASKFLPGTTQVVISLNSSSPDAALTLPDALFLLGAQMSDPFNDPWPSSASQLTSVDMDEDGKPGVTAFFSTDNGDLRPPTSVANTEHADRAYVANRIVFSLNGRLTSCTESKGTVDVKHLDWRLFGCHDDGASGECDANEVSTLDLYSLPRSEVTSATYTLVKIRDTATCADIRSM